MALFGDGLGSDDLTVQVGADTQGAVSGIDDLMGSLTGLRGATMLAGAALAGLAAKGLAEAIDAASTWEDQLVEVAKVTDDATAEELNQSLLELGQTLPVATTELANVAEIAGRLGIQGSENIEKFTETVSKIGVATDISAEEAAEDFARLSNALGVPISQIENMGSAVNTLANNFAASTSEIVSSMTRAAPAAAQLGVEFEDLAAIQTTLIASGMQVERAGSRMNTAFTRLAQGGEDVAAAMGMTTEEFTRLIEEEPTELLLRYLEHLSNIESRQERVTEATELFGRSGARAILTLASNYEDLDRAIVDSNDSMLRGQSLNEEFTKANQTFSAAVQRLENNLFETAVTTGTVLLPTLTDLVNRSNVLIDRFQTLGQRGSGAIDQIAERVLWLDDRLQNRLIPSLERLGQISVGMMAFPFGGPIGGWLLERGTRPEPEQSSGGSWRGLRESLTSPTGTAGGGGVGGGGGSLESRIAQRNQMISGRSTGGAGSIGVGGGEPEIMVMTTPEIRDALQAGVPGYRSENIGDRTAVTPSLIEHMGGQGGVRPEMVGLTDQQFNALIEGRGVGTTSSGGGGGSGSGVSMSSAMSNFGTHVNKLGSAVDRFVEGINRGLTVVVETDDGEFGRAVDARIESQSDVVRRRYGGAGIR